MQRWLVVGGSWGATLALAHALDEPDAVSGLLLRSVFLARECDIAAFFAGAPFMPARGDSDMQAGLDALCERFVNGDGPSQRAAALAWWQWELSRSGAAPAAAPPPAALIEALIDRYRVQAHYLRHGCWLQQPTLLSRCGALPPVSGLVLHSRDDRICSPEGALALQRAAPQLRLAWIDGAGHDAAHPAMVNAMVRALDAFAARRSFDAALPQMAGAAS